MDRPRQGRNYAIDCLSALSCLAVLVLVQCFENRGIVQVHDEVAGLPEYWLGSHQIAECEDHVVLFNQTCETGVVVPSDFEANTCPSRFTGGCEGHLVARRQNTSELPVANRGAAHALLERLVVEYEDRAQSWLIENMVSRPCSRVSQR